jgi:thiol:disulfide interchange protein DsbD
MRTTLSLAALAACLCLAAAPADPVAWKLQPLPPSLLKPGARFTVNLSAEIQEGWHLYSLKPMEEGPIPTRIWMPEGQPFALAGAVRAPEPRVMRDASFGLEVELYEGEAVFALPVKIAPGAAPGVQMLVVSASYQTCNNKICLPPKTVKIETPFSIAK